MEDMAYHLESENINLTDGNINDEDCAPFVSDHDESVCNRLSENDFQTIDHEHFGDVTSFQGLHSRYDVLPSLNIFYNNSLKEV